MAVSVTQRTNDTFLNRVVLADGMVTAALGVSMLVASSLVAGVLGLNTTFVLVVGALCSGLGAILLWLALTNRVTRSIVTMLAVGEVAWVVLSIAALFEGWLAPTSAGWWAIVLQADMVALFAGLGFYGLRRR